MQISVEGWRASKNDWESVRTLPKEQLPALTVEQQIVATKLKISIEDYARSVLAGRRTSDGLLVKTASFGRLLEEKLKERVANGLVESVALETSEHKFRVLIQVGGKSAVLHIEEEIVDDLFEGGSSEAEKKILRILDLAMHEKVA